VDRKQSTKFYYAVTLQWLSHAESVSEIVII